jgi:DNA (cytosine-5)-methyltransferase 1
MLPALYNEIEPFAASWLRNLSDAGHIAPGAVDARSIRELRPADLVGVVQFHAFAGLGAWSYALRLAGWPDDRPVWTGSCPCQPFSDAGKGGGFDDPRHLWPEWFRLIRERRPAVVFGEQVASGDGLVWLDLVRADLEGEGYAVGAADLCAAGVGAPHIRQRLFFGAVRLADAGSERREQHGERDGGAVGGEPASRGDDAGRCGAVLRLADAGGEGLPDAEPAHVRGAGRREEGRAAEQRGVSPAPWDDVEWLNCRDGKRRPTQRGLRPLADGAPNRVGVLRAGGNAICPQAAAAFVIAFMDAIRAREAA